MDDAKLWKLVLLLGFEPEELGGPALAPIHRKDECRGVLKG